MYNNQRKPVNLSPAFALFIIFTVREMKDMLLEYLTDYEFIKCYESTLKQEGNCPKKHGLKAFIINSAGWGCDKCRINGVMIKGHMAYGCRICNWDACENCYEDVISESNDEQFKRIMMDYFQARGKKFLDYDSCKAEAMKSKLDNYIFTIAFKSEH